MLERQSFFCERKRALVILLMAQVVDNIFITPLVDDLDVSWIYIHIMICNNILFNFYRISLLSLKSSNMSLNHISCQKIKWKILDRLQKSRIENKWNKVATLAIQQDQFKDLSINSSCHFQIQRKMCGCYCYDFKLCSNYCNGCWLRCRRRCGGYCYDIK